MIHKCNFCDPHVAVSVGGIHPDGFFTSIRNLPVEITMATANQVPIIFKCRTDDWPLRLHLQITDNTEDVLFCSKWTSWLVISFKFSGVPLIVRPIHLGTIITPIPTLSAHLESIWNDSHESLNLDTTLKNLLQSLRPVFFNLIKQPKMRVRTWLIKNVWFQMWTLENRLIWRTSRISLSNTLVKWPESQPGLVLRGTTDM